LWSRCCFHSVGTCRLAVHEPTDALDQILRSELFLDQHGLHTGVQSLAVFRPRRDRPRAGRAAEPRDELAPPHSITSSARASNAGGTLSPSARAVGKLMTSSNLVDRTTGKSAGLVPLRIRTV